MSFFTLVFRSNGMRVPARLIVYPVDESANSSAQYLPSLGQDPSILSEGNKFEHGLTLPWPMVRYAAMIASRSASARVLLT